MSNNIERPIFYEGQVLGAADLEAAVEHGRGQQARHNRGLHTWGIARGLELDDGGKAKEKKAADGSPYREITLKAGMAIDITGREIVVVEDERLIEDDFFQQGVASGNKEDPSGDNWYPVF